MSYDYIIMGGGAGGVMAAYTINSLEPTKTILVLEKNNKTLSDYRAKGYDSILNWFSAQNDTDFTNSSLSTDNKTVWVGEGLGGGTLHFGLQYIDHPDVINKNHSDLLTIINNMATITNAQRYSYATANSPNTAWYNLKQSLESDTSILTQNNKIYCDNLSTGSRILIGELIENKSNIEIKYNVTVNKIAISGGAVTQVETSDGNYTATNYILAAGAIQSPVILLKSGISTGTKLYDHAGYTLLYKKQVTTTTTTTETTVSGYTDAELTNLGLMKYIISGGGSNDLSVINQGGPGDKMIAIFRHTKLSTADVALAKAGTQPTGSVTLGEGVYYVYDMGTYWSGGSGNRYVLNGETSYDSSKKYGLYTNTYTFTNVSSNHPIAILNIGNTNISYSPVNTTPIIIKVSGGSFGATNGDYYTFKDSNDNDINIGNGSFRFMRGQSYKFQANGISSNHPFFIYYNGSSTSSISGNTGEISFTIPANHSTTAGDIYYQCEYHSSMKSNISLLNKVISGTTNDGRYDFYYGDVTVTVSGDFGTVSVYCYYHGYMGGENLLTYTTSCNNNVNVPSNVTCLTTSSQVNIVTLGGHPGGDVIRSQLGTSYDLTSVLTGQHGQAYNRLFTGGAKLIGVKEGTSTTTTTTTTDVSDLGFGNIVGHLQTRDTGMNWQTYYSTVPALPSKLIVTHAQGVHISGAGSISLDGNNNPVVTLNHLGSGGFKTLTLAYLLQAYQKNHAILTNAGYVLDSNFTINTGYIENAVNSIYHYQGGASDVLDNNNQVLGVSNLYVGDSSALKDPWPGSTSVPSMAMGYKVANYIYNINQPTIPFIYNDEVIDMLLKKSLGAAYTSKLYVTGQETPILSNIQTKQIFASPITNMPSNLLDWSTTSTAVTGGGTYKTLDYVNGETLPESFTYIRKYENIPMSVVAGTNNRSWKPTESTFQEKFNNVILGKPNFSYILSTDITNYETILSSSSAFKPIINNGVLTFLGNSVPQSNTVLKLKEVYIYDGEMGAVGSVKLNDFDDVILGDSTIAQNTQPLAYDTITGVWKEGSISMPYMPIQKINDFLEVNTTGVINLDSIIYQSATTSYKPGKINRILDNYNDVSISSPVTTNYGVIYKNNEWGAHPVQTPPLTSIVDLPDVDISANLLTNNQGLLYDTLFSSFGRGNIQLPIPNLDYFNDVNTAGVPDDFRLNWNAKDLEWNFTEVGDVVNNLLDIRDVDTSNLRDETPQWSQVLKLEPIQKQANANFGNSVAIDISYALVGSYVRDTGVDVDIGAAYLFKHNSFDPTDWGQISKLYPLSANAGMKFGSSVKINSSFAMVTAPYHSYVDGNTYIQAGSVYVFNHNSTTGYYGVQNGIIWNESSIIRPTTKTSYDTFGSSIDMSGNYLIVGAIEKDATSNKGKAYMFYYENGNWVEKKILTADDGVNGDEFGYSVATNQEYAFVGAPNHDSNKGKVYLFKKNHLGNDNWGLLKKIQPTYIAPNDYFGTAIAVNNHNAFISSPGTTDTSGAVYYFSERLDVWGVDVGGEWKENHKMTASDGENNNKFGISLAVSNTIAVVGSSLQDISGNVDSGAAYIFYNTGEGYWEEAEKITAADIEAGDEFGISVAVHYKTVTVGAWKEDDPNNGGSMYMYHLPEQSTGTRILLFDVQTSRWKVGVITSSGAGIFVTRLNHLSDVDLSNNNYPVTATSTLMYDSASKVWLPKDFEPTLSSINDLPLIDTTGAQADNILQYDGTSFKPATFQTPITSLGDIGDIVIGNTTTNIALENGHGLVYNDASGGWVNSNIGGGLADGVETGTDKVNTLVNMESGSLFYNTVDHIFYNKIDTGWLQMMLEKNPLIFGKPTLSFQDWEVKVTGTTKIEISWTIPKQFPTILEAENTNDNIGGIYYLPSIYNIYFELAHQSDAFDEFYSVLIGGRDKNQTLSQATGSNKLTSKIILYSGSGTDNVYNEGGINVYKWYNISTGNTRKFRIWAENNTPGSNIYKVFENITF